MLLSQCLLKVPVVIVKVLNSYSCRYVLYGDISAKVAYEMRKPEVADFFARLIQRVAPKSYPQAMAELVVTRRFYENFGGDQVRTRSLYKPQFSYDGNL